MAVPALLNAAGLLEWARRVRLALNPVVQGYPYQSLDTAPTGIEASFTYYDTTLGKVRTWDGVIWNNHF